MIKNIESAIEILENHCNDIPFEAIEFLYNHEHDDRILEKVIYHLTNAYNDELYHDPLSEYLLHTPLWFAIVAEKHHSVKIIDPVINLFITTFHVCDYLSEQGQYLIGLLTEKYPEIVAPKVLDIIDALSDTDSKLNYLYLFDFLLFTDIEKHKGQILKILSKDTFYWYESFAIMVSVAKIKDAIPILQSKIDESKRKKIPDFDRPFYMELENNIDKFHKNLMRPRAFSSLYKSRQDWINHYSLTINFDFDTYERHERH